MAELRQRAVKWTDSDWQAVQKSAKVAGKTAAEWVRERTLTEPSTDPAVDPVMAAIVDRLTAERDAALKLAKLAEENVAEGDYGLGDLAGRIGERATEMGKTPADWVRSFVQFVLDGKKVMPKQDGVQYEKATEKKTAESDARAAAILEESARRQAAHIANGGTPWPNLTPRWAGVTVAPKGAPFTTRKANESGPPNWLTLPTTVPGTRKVDVIDDLIATIESQIGAQMKRDAKRNEKARAYA